MEAVKTRATRASTLTSRTSLQDTFGADASPTSPGVQPTWR